MIPYKVQKYFNLNLDATVCNSAAAPEISSYFENTFILVTGYSFDTSLAPPAVSEHQTETCENVCDMNAIANHPDDVVI